MVSTLDSYIAICSMSLTYAHATSLLTRSSIVMTPAQAINRAHTCATVARQLEAQRRVVSLVDADADIEIGEHFLPLILQQADF